MNTSTIVVIEREANAAPEDLTALRAAGILVLEVDQATRVQVRMLGAGTDRIALHALQGLQTMGNNDQARKVLALIAERMIEDARQELIKREKQG